MAGHFWRSRFRLDGGGNLSLVWKGQDCINIKRVKYPTQDVENYVEDAKIKEFFAFLYLCLSHAAGKADTETYGVFYQHGYCRRGWCRRRSEARHRQGEPLYQERCTGSARCLRMSLLPLPPVLIRQNSLVKFPTHSCPRRISTKIQ